MASQVVRIICPNLRCRAILSVPAVARGKTVRCRQCSTRVRVPATSVVQPVTTKAEDEDQDEPRTHAKR